MRIEKVHDIRRHLLLLGMTYELFPTPRVGVVNLKVARVLAFLIIVISVVASAVVCVMAVWEVIAPLYAWRALGSLGIVSTSVAILLILNESFGPAVRGYPLARRTPTDDFPKTASTPPETPKSWPAEK
jgi:hypothetical protein